MKHKKRGRPSKYNLSFCDSLVCFFDISPYNIKDITITKPDGTTIEKTEREANDLPFFCDWCKLVGINQDTMHEWIKKHPKFSDAYKNANELREKILVVNALQGLYANAFAIFTAKNKFGWRDEQQLIGNQTQIVQVYIPKQNEAGTTDNQLASASRTADLIPSEPGV